jgi:hypothetical protein
MPHGQELGRKSEITGFSQPDAITNILEQRAILIYRLVVWGCRPC